MRLRLRVVHFAKIELLRLITVVVATDNPIVQPRIIWRLPSCAGMRALNLAPGRIQHGILIRLQLVKIEGGAF